MENEYWLFSLIFLKQPKKNMGKYSKTYTWFFKKSQNKYESLFCYLQCQFYCINPFSLHVLSFGEEWECIWAIFLSHNKRTVPLKKPKWSNIIINNLIWKEHVLMQIYSVMLVFFFFKLKTAITVHLLLHFKMSSSAYPTHLPNIEMTTEGTNLSIPFPLLILNSKISITFWYFYLISGHYFHTQSPSLSTSFFMLPL